MTEPGIHIEGMDALLAKIQTLKQLKQLRGTLLAAGAHVAGKLKEYPPASHRKQPFLSEKQRRYVFWAMGKGIIEIPYRRGQSPGSRNLKQQWTVVAESDMRVMVNNPTPYGPLVQGKDEQARYHQATGWPTDEGVAESEMDTVVEFVEKGLEEIVGQD